MTYRRENAIPDERLVANALQGDDGAFVQLVTKFKLKIFHMAGRFTSRPEELEDLCQDIFLKAYENLSKFRNDAPFEHWLSRIAIRSCYDFLRNIKRSGRQAPIEDIGHTLEDPSAAVQVKAFHAHQLLHWGLAQLGAKERLVITLVELEEKSIRDVASLTGWTESNVKVRVFRARQQLKKILGTHYAH